MQLLLEPLSYRVDLRRLLQRAEGTQWDFSPVSSWLEQGLGGSRALCIASGAGEGKSTVSAAMCDPAAGAFRDAISAHHFLKHSDQRRLQPVRVVKSLAFQLAVRWVPPTECTGRLCY